MLNHILVRYETILTFMHAAFQIVLAGNCHCQWSKLFRIEISGWFQIHKLTWCC